MPFYQSALGDRLEYEFTFNDYSRAIRAKGDADASYDIENISLEYEIVTQPKRDRMNANQYNGRLAIPCDRILRHRKISRDKSDTLWNINLNLPARSMKGVLMLFEDVAAQQPFARNSGSFYNPKITKVEVTIEGIPNQLFSQGMHAYQMWDEARKLFAPGRKRHPEMAVVAKDLGLADVSLGEFLTSKFALWLNLRTTDDDRLHGSGRRIENASEGVTIQLTKKAEAAGSSQLFINHLLPKGTHSAIVCGQRGCGKTVFVLSLLEEGPYIVVLCPTIEHNKTYKQCPWFWADPEVYVLDPGERLHDYLRAFYLVFKGEPTLFMIDDCSATKALTKKKELAFSGRHADISVWVLIQKYNSVLKELREQTRWVALFNCKDRDSFEDCLRENDVILTREQRALVRQQLSERKHAKLLLKTDQPAAYIVM